MFDNFDIRLDVNKFTEETERENFYKFFFAFHCHKCSESDYEKLEQKKNWNKKEDLKKIARPE
jgi:hypothetical protein